MFEGQEDPRVVAQASFPRTAGRIPAGAEEDLAAFGVVQPAERAYRMKSVEVERVSSVAELVTAGVSIRWQFDRRGNETEGKE